MPAIATCLLGVLAGHVLVAPGLDRAARCQVLLLAGMACLVAGMLWSFNLPVIKKLWTSSFVLVAGGWSLLLLGLFYATIDGAGLRRWATVFVWVGSNAIALYLVQNLVGFEMLADHLQMKAMRGTMLPRAPLPRRKK